MESRVPLSRAVVQLVASLCFVAGATPAVATPALPVAVTNTPTVNANVVNSAITVQNTRAAPLFVSTQPVPSSGMGSSCDIRQTPGATDGTLQCQVSLVPAGKVLVIETMTCFAQVVDGTPFNGLVLTVGAPNPLLPAAGNLATLNHFIPLTRNANGDYGGINAYAMISPVRIYAFGGDPVTGGDVPIYVFGGVGTNPTNTFPSLGCTISGHFEAQ
jgi:hypothetical protein